MPRERNPNRDRAAEIYRQHDGNISNRKIAEMLGEDEKVIAVWKSRDKKAWGIDVVQQSKPKVVQQKKRPAPRERPEAPPPSEELSEKHRIFVMEYLRDFNATRAAMAAGYSKRSAYTEGWRLLKHADVQSEIKRLQEEMAGELWLDIKRVIAEYMKIAFADVADVLDFGMEEKAVYDMEGNPVPDPETGEQMKYKRNYVTFKNVDQIDSSVISEVKQGKDGVSIKLHDKMRALEKLEKYLGYMTEEDRLKLDKLRAEVKTLQGDGGKPVDDGFIEALRGRAAEVWKTETDDPEKQSNDE